MSDRSNPIAFVVRRLATVPAGALAPAPEGPVALTCAGCNERLALSPAAFFLHRILTWRNERTVLLVCELCARGPMRTKLYAISKVNRIIHDRSIIKPKPTVRH
jgi:hypothetical protein